MRQTRSCWRGIFLLSVMLLFFLNSFSLLPVFVLSKSKHSPDWFLELNNHLMLKSHADVPKCQLLLTTSKDTMEGWTHCTLVLSVAVPCIQVGVFFWGLPSICSTSSTIICFRVLLLVWFRLIIDNVFRTVSLLNLLFMMTHITMSFPCNYWGAMMFLKPLS